MNFSLTLEIFIMVRRLFQIIFDIDNFLSSTIAIRMTGQFLGRYFKCEKNQGYSKNKRCIPELNWSKNKGKKKSQITIAFSVKF